LLFSVALENTIRKVQANQDGLMLNRVDADVVNVLGKNTFTVNNSRKLLKRSA
jgi:hypothetical protein